MPNNIKKYKMRNSKNIIALIALIICFSCKAQSPVIPIYEREEILPPVNSYEKDIDNDFNKFIGTWKWENGATSIMFEFDKLVMYYDSREERYMDRLIGEIKYIENGTEIMDTRPINTNTTDIYETSTITDLTITTLNRGFPPCNECPSGTRFIRASYHDPLVPVFGTLIMAHFTDSNGVEKIRMRIVASFVDPDAENHNTQPLELTIPEGIYTFTKQ